MNMSGFLQISEINKGVLMNLVLLQYRIPLNKGIPIIKGIIREREGNRELKIWKLYPVIQKGTLTMNPV